MNRNLLMCMAPLVAIMVMAGCDESGTDEQTDTETDGTPDVVDDTMTMDSVDDPVEEPELDVVEEPGCVYPPEPYSFSFVGDIAGPMAWPGAVKGPEETSDYLTPDLEAFFCDPDIQSVIVVISTTWCPYCPDRVENLAGLQDHYETYGARFVWVLGDGTSAAQSYEYFSSHGASFGWFTDDSDNTMGANLISGSGMLEGVPWVFVLDAESMEVIYNNPTSVYSITKQLYED